MITKSDVLLLLTDIGPEAQVEIDKLYKSPSIPLSALKLINDRRSMEIIKFYEKLRRSYNDKRSKLYINIMKANDNAISDPITVVTTLSALLNQIFQYKVDNKSMFFKAVRADEIIKVLSLYASNREIDPALKLLNLFRIDIMALEVVSGHRKDA